MFGAKSYTFSPGRYGDAPWDKMGIDTKDVKQALLDGRRLTMPDLIYADDEPGTPAATKRLDAFSA